MPQCTIGQEAFFLKNSSTLSLMQALQGGRVLHPSPCQLLMTAGYPRPYTLASRAAMPLLLNLC